MGMKGMISMSKPFMTGTSVTDVTISVRDLNRSLDYYRSDLGFSLLKRSVDSADLGTPSGIRLITLLERKDAIAIKRQLGLYHFAILLPSRKDLGAFLRHLIVRQTPVGGSADHGVSEAFYLEDPDHNGIEVYADKDSSLWQDEFGQTTMTTQALDYSSLYYEVETDDAYRGIPDGTILGHLHLYVGNLERTKRFYVEGIGLKVTVDTYPGALFLSDNGYHHHLGVNTWLGKNAMPRRKDSIGLESASFGFGTCEALMDALARLKSLSAPIREENGAYVTADPDGNALRLYLKS
jgi:catechol 2,3-dioxygenase